ncbi:hypothetical protein RQP46_007800 [Phenoliferia psychrophenolica]
MHLSTAAFSVMLAFLAASPVSAAAMGRRETETGPTYEVTSPGAGDAWVEGHTYPVEWKTSSDDSDDRGTLWLGNGYNNSGLMLHRLASDVPIYKTDSYRVTLPTGLYHSDSTYYLISLISDTQQFAVSEKFYVNPQTGPDGH